MVAAVQSLTRPSGTANLVGPPPTDDEGDPLAPADIWGHDHLWWLDRMIRSDQPLVERMALVFHDWFAADDRGGVKSYTLSRQTVRPGALRVQLQNKGAKTPTTWTSSGSARPANRSAKR